MKKIGFLFVTILMMVFFAVSASAATEGYYTYDLYDGNAIITDVDRSISGEVTIPSTLGGYTVTSIGCQAFANCESVIRITIPDSVTSIEPSAFLCCRSLTNVTIPDSVASIGYSAFAYCENLTSITIPDSVASIGEGAFRDCNSLTNITVDVDNEYYSSDSNGVLFDKNKNELIQYPNGNTRTTYIIPDSVTSIGGYAFICCDSLTSITIPDSVTSIDNSAFYGCTDLTSITVDENNKNYSSDNYGVLFNKDKTKLIKYPIGNTRTAYIIPVGVTSIGDNAFRDCKSLANITIPVSVTSIGFAAFEYCSSLTYVNYKGTLEQWSKIEGNYELTKMLKLNCSCNCHKTDIVGFFWKIANFFNRLFKVKNKQMCACGIAHY